MKKVKRTLSKSEALKKLQHYCAYQERCHKEVRNKLLDLGVYGMDLEEVITELIADNYLNEERFACVYAGGKFRVKRWGRLRILRELKRRGISDYCIKKAMQEIPEVDYRKTIAMLLEKKEKELGEYPAFERKHRLSSYLISKGYEAALVWEMISGKN
ncbi:MAG TPA: RecX family transcriptional regulator [Phaeodactylibacter sp.]|nr:RecX family transcriptional regulator [Phaeodactylibacter sp.]